MNRLYILTAFILIALHGYAQQKPRARDLGIPFHGTPGKWNAITDVAGVAVGYSTLVSGKSLAGTTRGIVRTGVTAIIPQLNSPTGRVFAAWGTLNGNGEMTGTTWVEESGGLGTPVLITNTHSVGTVRDAVIAHYADGFPNDYSGDISLPVVAETWDGFLNDINGFHVKPEHAYAALKSAVSGPIAEGNVGGGTGMIAHQFKGGTGTASRIVLVEGKNYSLGILVQANYGRRELLTIAGVPVGREIGDLLPVEGHADKDQGSIIVVLATDAPLLPHQLKRLCRRIPLGIAAVGGRGGNSSGDIFIAFSTANPQVSADNGLVNLVMIPNEQLSPLFEATAEATEEAIVNALVAAETLDGVQGRKVFAIPHDRLRQVLKKYNRLN